MFRTATIVLILFGLLSALVLAGCKPPKSQDEVLFGNDTGRKIQTIDPQYPGDFKTVEKDGVEFLQARGEVGKYGGTFHENQIGEGPRTFNPWASYDATSTAMGGMLFAGLVQTDAYTGLPVPYMAEKVDIKPDNMTYVVTLRKGLEWSDGKPITSDDVVFTWNEIVKEGFGNPSTRDTLLIDGEFPRVRALDKMTIEFKTPKPFAPFHAQLAEVIAPAHVFQPILEEAARGLTDPEKIREAKDKAFAAYWGTSDATDNPERFVSSNMWLLESYTPGRRATFTRNPKFFMIDKAGNRLPYLDRYIINFVSDMNNEILAFMQGGSDSYSIRGQYLTFVRQLPKPQFDIYNLGPASGTTIISPRRRPTTRARPIRLRRLPATISSGPTPTPTACLSSYPTARTTTAPSNFQRS